jgi:hypothetical protein
MAPTIGVRWCVLRVAGVARIHCMTNVTPAAIDIKKDRPITRPIAPSTVARGRDGKIGVDRRVSIAGV